MHMLFSKEGRAEAKRAIKVHLLLREDVLLALQQRDESICHASVPAEGARISGAQGLKLFCLEKRIPTKT